MASSTRYQPLPANEATTNSDTTSFLYPPTSSFSPSSHDTDQFAFSTTLRKASSSDSPYTNADHGSVYPPRPNPSTTSSPRHPHKSRRSDEPNGQTPSHTQLTSHALSVSARFTHLSVQETLQAFHCPSLESGLSSNQVYHARREAGGFNELAVREGQQPWKKFLGQFQEPLIMLLLGSAAVSLLTGQIDDAVSITVAIIIVISVGFYQEQKSEKSLEALNKLVPHYCNLVRDGVTSHVLANELVPGDIVTFTTGDRIPADVRICQSVSLEIDESTLTGEIKPRKKHSDPVPHQSLQDANAENPLNDAQNPYSPGSITSINERENIAFMGTLAKSGHGCGVVISTGIKTEFGMIFSMVDEVVEKRTPLQLSMDELAKKLSMISLAVIAVICLMGVWQKRPWLEMFTIGVSLAVAAIPEGLPIVVTVTLALGVLRMSHRKAIVKKLPSVETLGSVSVICSDKTGTLTANEMTVIKVYTAEDGNLDLVYSTVPQFQSKSLSKLLLVGNLCNNSHRNEQGANVGQATDVAMVNVLRTFGLEDKRPYFKRNSEIAFGSEHKFMAVTGVLSTSVPAQETMYLKGAFEVVLEHCSTIYGSEGQVLRLDENWRKQVTQVAYQFSSQGLRVIASAMGGVGSQESKTMTLCGLHAMQDPPRPRVKEAIAALARGGVQVVMITGDAETTATVMAKQLGILLSSSPSAVMTGRQLDSLTERQIQERIRGVSVFSRTTPRHKMTIIAAYQANGAVVAMTGDGVNDAPALKMADIGISMGKGGTDVAKEASDVILVDDNFSTILSAVEEGKGIFYNIQNFLSFQLSTAVAALTLITLSTAFQLKLPLNAMQILFINILMDGPPSQSLGVDPVDGEAVMRRPPRSKTAPVINRRLLWRISFSASMVVLGTLYIYVHELSEGVADTRDSTMTFTCFVFLDLISAIQNRGLNTPLTANRMLCLTVSISLLAQLFMVYVPLLQSVFQTTALSVKDLGLLALIAATSFSLHEARRTYERTISVKEAESEEKDVWV